MTRFSQRFRLTGGSEANSVNKWFGGGFAAEPNSFESIATLNGTGSATTFTFSSIPATFTHLQLRYRSTGGYCGLTITFNSDTSAVYYNHQLNGTGASLVSSLGVALNGLTDGRYSGYATDTFSVGIGDILDYASTTKKKTYRELFGYDGNGVGNIILYSGLWSNTAAITSITITNVSGNPQTTASQFSLYGIKEAV
jgi:hypothetical protein